MRQHTFQKPDLDFQVEYQELQDIIRAYFGRPDFRFLDHIYDVANDTYQIFEVGCGLDKLDQKEVVDWINGEDNQVYVAKLLDTLAAQDIIPDGDYLVKISW